MPVDRDKWDSFAARSVPSWPCPHCATGTLQFVKDRRVEDQRPGSKREKQENPDWEPEWYIGDFAALLLCPHCQQTVSLIGTTSFEYVTDAPDDVDQEDRWDMTYKPTAFAPGPPLFQIPGKCPKEIRTELARAWTLFWVDAAACANRIRSCVEMILTHEGIKRFERSSTGKRNRLPLHKRINLFKQQEPALADAMMAVKWLGNVGSHGGEEVPRSEILNGLDLLEHVLIEVLEKRSKVLARIGRDLIRRKGRPRRRAAPS